MDTEKCERILDKTTQMIQAGNESLSTIERIMSIRRDCEIMAQKTEQVRMITDAQIKAIQANFKNNQDLIQKAFWEREEALTRYFEVLDGAIERNDREMILSAMKSISVVVANSPVPDKIRFAPIFDTVDQPLLDF